MCSLSNGIPKLNRITFIINEQFVIVVLFGTTNRTILRITIFSILFS